MTGWVPWGFFLTTGVLGVLAVLLRGLRAHLSGPDRQVAWFLWWATLVLAYGLLLLGALGLPDASGPPPGSTPAPTPAGA